MLIFTDSNVAIILRDLKALLHEFRDGLFEKIVPPAETNVIAVKSQTIRGLLMDLQQHRLRIDTGAQAREIAHLIQLCQDIVVIAKETRNDGYTKETGSELLYSLPELTYPQVKE